MFQRVIVPALLCALASALAVPAAIAVPRPSKVEVNRPGETPRPEAESATAEAEATSVVSAASTAAATLPATAATAPAVNWRGARAAFEGFYINLDLGYGMTSGTDGPNVPGVVLNGGGQAAFDRLITTNRGAGFAFGFQLGYNIKGYVSIGGELSWQGAGFGKGKDTEGAVAASIIVGLHPLRFWRDNLPVDLRLYAGYSPFDINYYYETATDPRGSGKSWTGTSIPFGFSFGYRVPDSVFVIGFDMRFAAASYKTWWYNYDKDIKFEPNPPEKTFRTTPRLMLGWHF